MRHDSETIEIVADRELVYDECKPWALFDPAEHSAFFPEEQRSLSAFSSENSQYWAAYARRDSETFDGVVEPAGICLIVDHEVVQTSLMESVKRAEPANDGTVVCVDGNASILTALDSSGQIVLQDEFESNMGTIAISPDGRYVAAATAFPDNAVHLYDLKKQQYLGRKENSTTTVIMRLEFESVSRGYVVNTYEIHPDEPLAEKVDPSRTEVIDRIPAGPIENERELDGTGIVVEGSTWHHVPATSLTEVSGDLRVPGVTVEASCGVTIEPLTAELIFEDASQARRSKHDICSACKPASLSTPSEKVERTF